MLHLFEMSDENFKILVKIYLTVIGTDLGTYASGEISPNTFYHLAVFWQGLFVCFHRHKLYAEIEKVKMSEAQTWFKVSIRQQN